MRARAWSGVFWVLATLAASGAWRTAEPGWEYEFPRDHGSHAGFRTEWWYFTGNLRAADGREFGCQLTFFRQGVRSDGEDRITISRFVTSDVKFAHFAVTDLATGRFAAFQKFSRGAYGEAGFDVGSKLAWIDDWVCERTDDGAFRLRASAGDVAVDLALHPAKPPAVHGRDGVSAKSAAGTGSHYYSITRLETTGTISMAGVTHQVAGRSWFDHEWASNQLAKGQTGWDWLSLQLEDGRDLMLFRVRAADGADFFGGSAVAADGSVTPLDPAQISMTPTENWTSPETSATYPIAWTIRLPEMDLDLHVRAAQPNQELALHPVTYWEGAVRAEGKSLGLPVRGAGYLELSGYSGALPGLGGP